MHKVERIEEPAILLINKMQWTKQLLEQIEICGDYKSVDKQYKERYRTQQVKAALQKMYKGLCCYCEYMLDISDYSHIEHLKPKCRPEFHKLTFEWDNLHLACNRCNNNKGDKWDEQRPFIDPTKEEPTEFIVYDDLGYAKAVHDNLRGQFLIDSVQLNRAGLLKGRRIVIIQLLKHFDEVETIQGVQAVCEHYERLIEEGVSFCTIFRNFIEKYKNIHK
ncbi:MAG: TIGR02646 family protein [Hyphomonadaceae bacterium]|nr:TIGR02646 family protein [Clostridia bacterium]